MDPVLVKAYRLFRKIAAYPGLLGELRRSFAAALDEDLGIGAEALDREALALARRLHASPGAELVNECRDVLIDLHFATHFSDDAIDNHINLVRKREKFQRLARVVNLEGATARDIKQALEDFCAIPQGDLTIPPSESEGVRVALIDRFISNQLPFVSVAKHHFSLRDISEMLARTTWSARHPGKIGGKAAGMLLAYKILVPRFAARDAELADRVALPDSFYFNSGILSDFIDHNELYAFHSQKYKSREAIEADYQHIGERFARAAYPPEIVADFRAFLEQLGEHPLILRSSSLLEDNFGFAFSGKYESVFLTNQGNLEARLEAFIHAMKRVHMSTLAPAPILYRRDHNLLDFDERMSVLVQKVVGRRFGDLFLPFVSGVAFSHNAYHWTPRIRKEDGLVRLVLGLGTRAVERVGQDYPRMVPLSHPLLRPEVEPEKIRRYSQKLVDVLNLATGRLETHPFMDVLERTQHPDTHAALSLLEDGHLAAPLFRGLAVDLSRSCLTFDPFLVRSPFVDILKRVLRRLEEAYGRPVDVEFAWDDDRLYVLQCRSLAVHRGLASVALPGNVPYEDVLFTNQRGVTNSITRDVEYIVYVDPRAYHRLASCEEKTAIARVVGRVNRILENERYALFGPGRWGSNDINLGIRVGYGDIHRTLILGEIAFEEAGSTPEVSYGTHFFNDLVEAQIVPVAIYPDDPGTLFREAFFTTSANLLATLVPDLESYAGVVRVIHVPAASHGKLLHVYQNGIEQRGMGFLARSEESRARQAS
jgi:hypothetical protein